MSGGLFDSGVTILASPNAQHQMAHAQAMAEGLKRHGIKTTVTANPPCYTKAVVCWGWRMGLRLKLQGKRVLVMERGYLGDRFAWTSLGWDGLNGLAKFHAPDDGGERFRKHFGPLQPWKEGGEYALVVGQVAGDASLRGKNLVPWYAQMAALLGDQGHHVVFRPHPRGHSGRMKIKGAETRTGDLAEALAGAKFVVTFNSNTGVDAVVAGVPAIVMDEGGMAYPVAGHRLGEIVRPEREAWAHRLAWCQWRLDEMRSGEAWEVVRQACE